MSHGAAKVVVEARLGGVGGGGTIHYQLIYPQEMEKKKNSIRVLKSGRGFMNCLALFLHKP